MRILYIASNPEGEPSLRIEQEITELQRAVTPYGVDFAFLPALAFEDLEAQMSAYSPDIVHFSAHGDPGQLILANQAEGAVRLTAEALRVVLSVKPPKLVYINACTSEELATKLSTSIPFVIGTTQPITNLAARKGAVNFYRTLLDGHSVQRAFESSKVTVNVLSEGKVETVLKPNPLHNPEREKLFEPMRLIGCFTNHAFDVTHQKVFSLEFGVAGCRHDTAQVTLCTDDYTFIEDGNAEDIASDVCSAVSDTPIHGEIWLPRPWRDIEGDFRMYVLSSTANGRCFCVASTAREALENFYRVYFDTPDGSGFPDELKAALTLLRSNDGSRLRPAPTAPANHSPRGKTIKRKRPGSRDKFEA